VGQGPVGAERRVLPYRSSGSASPVATLAGGAFWDASAREVAGATSQVGVRTCAECELSLSATARFCRRCGHPQSQSA
jgi:ribosomal protein L40E